MNDDDHLTLEVQPQELGKRVCVCALEVCSAWRSCILLVVPRF